jgi:hypothetical protein
MSELLLNGLYPAGTATPSHFDNRAGERRKKNAAANVQKQIFKQL